MADRGKDICRCGVYRFVHGKRVLDCERFRRAWGVRLWLMNHDPMRHITGWAWLNLRGDGSRWAVAERYFRRHPELCWCEMADAALLKGKEGDYRKPNGCGCHVPRVRDAGLIRPDNCYCDYWERTDD